MNIDLDPMAVMDQFHPPGALCRKVVKTHGLQVAKKAVALAESLSGLEVDVIFIRQAAILHDIGVFMTRAPAIGCNGSEPYIRHGVLGADILRKMGLEKHARVCERHVGVGVSAAEIRACGLPLPQRDMVPRTLEEELICYADKFFSKTDPGKEKTVGEISAFLAKFGPDKVAVFMDWVRRFEPGWA